MSVTTSQRINQDQLNAAIPPGTTYTWTGGALESPDAKTITPVGFDDATLATAINTAAGSFIDYVANAATLRTKAQQALTTNANYLALSSPTQAQALAQVTALTRQMNGLIRLLIGDLSGTN